MNLKIFSLVIAITACGKKSSGDAASSTASILEGVWKTSCLTVTNEDASKSYLQFVLTYTEKSFVNNITYYKSDNCSVSNPVYTYQGTFSIGDAFSTISGAYKLDSKYTAVFARTSDAEYVSAANDNALYGYTDWVIDVDKDIAGKKASDSDAAEPSIGDFNYDIFKIDGKTLELGDSNTGDGSIESNRPTALDKTIIATKQ